jgi:hypothetical protein
MRPALGQADALSWASSLSGDTMVKAVWRIWWVGLPQLPHCFCWCCLWMGSHVLVLFSLIVGCSS